MHTDDSHHSMNSSNAVYCFHSDSLSRPVHFDDDAGPLANDNHTMLRHVANVPNMNEPTGFGSNLVNSDGNYAGDDGEGGGGANGDLNDCCDSVTLRLHATAAAAAEAAVVASMCRLEWLGHELVHHMEFQIEFSIVPCNNDTAMSLHTSPTLHDHCSIIFIFWKRREEKMSS